MNKEVWQALLALESRDIVSEWFEKIHQQQLNAQRSLEITMAAKQAREYFKNASIADYSVRPLLTFYGVASLSRSAALLFMKTTGEPALTAGHGLEAAGWGKVLSGEIGKALQNIGSLKIKTTSGLFNDFTRSINNRLPVHINSEVVTWRIDYDQPISGAELTLEDILNRHPDLNSEQKIIGTDTSYAYVNKLENCGSNAIKIVAHSENAAELGKLFEVCGYTVSINGNKMTLVIPLALFERNAPQLIHAYLDKTFGEIPRLCVVIPVDAQRYSQLSFTYMLGFVLGMLVRYYPTHWGAMISGSKGDKLWPIINRAQRVVEETFPELIYELIIDVLAHPFQRH